MIGPRLVTRWFLAPLLVAWVGLLWLDLRSARSGPVTSGPTKAVSIKISAVGDVMFGRYYSARRYRPFGLDRPFRHVKHLWKGDDIVMCNLETPISRKRYRRVLRSLSFRAEPKAAKLLKRAGFTLAVTANNHTHDQGDRGTAETIDHLTAAGLGVSGTGKTRAAAFKPWVFVKQGVRVGVISFTILRNFPTRERIGFAAFVRYRHAYREIPRWVRKARGKLDFLVVNLHFGAEYFRGVIRWERRLMTKLRKAGADVVFGHHPHVLRAVERRKDMAVFYSLGNFLFDFKRRYTDLTGVAQVTLHKRGAKRSIGRVRLIPAIRHWSGGLPKPATGSTAKRIRRMMWLFSRRMGIKKKNRFQRQGEAIDVQYRAGSGG